MELEKKSIKKISQLVEVTKSTTRVIRRGQSNKKNSTLKDP